MGFKVQTVMSARSIDVPEEVYIVVEFHQRDLRGIACINTALRAFEPKLAFPWHLSLLLQCVDMSEDRLPSASEQKILYVFEDTLQPLIKANGNALFLGRITHNGTRELIWRVSDPEMANSVMQNVLGTRNHPRPINYRIDEDRAWQKVSWHLDATTS